MCLLALLTCIKDKGGGWPQICPRIETGITAGNCTWNGTMARKQKRRWYANARMWLMIGAAAMILSAAAVGMNFAFDTKPL